MEAVGVELAGSGCELEMMERPWHSYGKDSMKGRAQRHRET